MNTNKVFFAFFIVLALTLNFGFFVGDFGNAAHHNVYELYAALVISLVATLLKLGDRTHIGAVLLATSLVADLQLLAAAFIWGYITHISQSAEAHSEFASVISLSGGALLANVLSVILLIIETVTVRR